MHLLSISYVRVSNDDNDLRDVTLLLGVIFKDTKDTHDSPILYIHTNTCCFIHVRKTNIFLIVIDIISFRFYNC
jgi:hypothetical protein